MGIKKRISTLATGLLIVVACTIGMAAPSFAAVSGTLTGTVYCSHNSDNNIVGIWVDAASGTDGYASWYTISQQGANWSYNLSQSTSSYSLHIGCGGTTQNWTYTFRISGLTSSNLYVYCAGDTCSSQY